MIRRLISCWLVNEFSTLNKCLIYCSSSLKPKLTSQKFEKTVYFKCLEGRRLTVMFVFLTINYKANFDAT